MNNINRLLYRRLFVEFLNPFFYTLEWSDVTFTLLYLLLNLCDLFWPDFKIVY